MGGHCSNDVNWIYLALGLLWMRWWTLGIL